MSPSIPLVSVLFFLLLSLCSPQLSLGGDEHAKLAKILIDRNKENFSRIHSWFGEATIIDKSDSGTTTIATSFGVDFVRGVDFFCSRMDKPAWSMGQLRNRAKFFDYQCLGEHETVNIQYTGIPTRRLNAATFDPTNVFYPMERELIEPWLKRLFELGRRTDFLVELSRDIENPNLIEVYFDSPASPTEGTRLVFDLNKGGNLIRVYNPGPGFDYECLTEYELLSGIWLPSRYTRRKIGPKPELREVRFKNDSVNEIVSSETYNIDRVFQLQNGAIIKDQASGKSHKYYRSDDQRPATEEESDSGPSFEFPQLLRAAICLGVALVLVVVFRSKTPVLRFASSNAVVMFFSVAALLPLALSFVVSPSEAGLKKLSNLDKLEHVEDLFCGHHCIRRLGRFLGVDVPEKSIASMMAVRKSGNSMLELKSTLEDLGLEVRAKETDFSNLSSEQLPCIAHLESPNHYVIVNCSADDPERLYVLDGARLRTEVNLLEVEKRWTGNILIANRPASYESENEDVTFDSFESDVGTLVKSAVVKQSFAFKNTGDAPVRIIGVHRTCDCLAAEFSEKEVPPGSRGEIKLEFNAFKAAEVNGDFKHSVVVELEGAYMSLHEVVVSGKIASDFYSESRSIATGALQSDSSHELTFPIIFPDKGIDLGNLPDIEIRGFEVENVGWRPDPESTSHGVVLFSFRIKVPEVERPTSQTGEIRISTKGSEGYSLVLPLHVSIQPDVIIKPEVLTGKLGETVTLFSEKPFQVIGDDLDGLVTRMEPQHGIFRTSIDASGIADGEWNIKLDVDGKPSVVTTEVSRAELGSP